GPVTELDAAGEIIAQVQFDRNDARHSSMDITTPPCGAAAAARSTGPSKVTTTTSHTFLSAFAFGGHAAAAGTQAILQMGSPIPTGVTPAQFTSALAAHATGFLQRRR